MARLPVLDNTGFKVNKKMPRRFQSGGTAAEDLPTATGGVGTTNVQQTGEITGFPRVATTEATQEQVTDRPAVQPVSGVIPQMKVGLTEGETVTPQRIRKSV